MTRMLAFPMRFENGRAVTVERDSDDEIIGCVHTTLLTRKGERIERPSFGIRSFEFDQYAPAVVSQSVRRSIMEAEPRARFVVSEDISDLAASVIGVNVGMEGSANG